MIGKSIKPTTNNLRPSGLATTGVVIALLGLIGVVELVAAEEVPLPTSDLSTAGKDSTPVRLDLYLKAKGDRAKFDELLKAENQQIRQISESRQEAHDHTSSNSQPPLPPMTIQDLRDWTLKFYGGETRLTELLSAFGQTPSDFWNLAEATWTTSPPEQSNPTPTGEDLERILDRIPAYRIELSTTAVPLPQSADESQVGVANRRAEQIATTASRAGLHSPDRKEILTLFKPLGAVYPGMLRPEIDRVVGTLKKGDVAGPFRTREGLQLFRVKGRSNLRELADQCLASLSDRTQPLKSRPCNKMKHSIEIIELMSGS